MAVRSGSGRTSLQVRDMPDAFECDSVGFCANHALYQLKSASRLFLQIYRDVMRLIKHIAGARVSSMLQFGYGIGCL
jgi:hypothetical protein